MDITQRRIAHPTIFNIVPCRNAMPYFYIIFDMQRHLQYLCMVSQIRWIDKEQTCNGNRIIVRTTTSTLNLITHLIVKNVTFSSETIVTICEFQTLLTSFAAWSISLQHVKLYIYYLGIAFHCICCPEVDNSPWARTVHRIWIDTMSSSQNKSRAYDNTTANMFPISWSSDGHNIWNPVLYYRIKFLQKKYHNE